MIGYSLSENDDIEFSIIMQALLQQRGIVESKPKPSQSVLTLIYQYLQEVK